MNKAADLSGEVTLTGSADRARWSGEPNWYLWDGGFMAAGRTRGVVPPHQHHAIQIVLAVDGTIGMRAEEGDWRTGAGVIVRPDVVHSYDGNEALGALMLIDPESLEGAWLRTSLREDITFVPEARIAACAKELRTFLERPLEALEIAPLVRHCVQAMCAGAPPTRRLDKRITKVIAAIRESDELRISIEEAAAMAFLSPSRFAHLFKQQVGLAFRHYLLWRKLARAMLVIGRQGTIAAAAHEADFADAAHLTRTFYQMFGLPPSVMMRGEFFEIPSPFDIPSAVQVPR
ncbi:MAG: helix-turn-helix domain-containing protein [Sphingomicrobium sp.]